MRDEVQRGWGHPGGARRRQDASGQHMLLRVVSAFHRHQLRMRAGEAGERAIRVDHTVIR